MSLAGQARPAPVQVLFSVSAVAISLLLAYECSRFVRTHSMRRPVSIVLAVATCLYFLANSLLVSGVLVPGKDANPARHLATMLLVRFPVLSAGGRGGRLMAASGREFGWKPPLLILPVMGLTFLFYRFYLARLAMLPAAAVSAVSLHAVEDPQRLSGRLSVCRAGTRAGAWRARQDKGRGRVSIRVAVGMPVARHPPHRSVRALLTHTVLTSDVFPREANVRSAYALQPAWPAIPAQGPARVRLYRVLLGQRPSLHDLLRPSLACVRPLRWYYAAVRLPMAVHVGLIAHRLLPPFRPLPAAESHRVSRFSRVKFPCMPGVYDSAVPATHKRITRATVLPSGLPDTVRI
jgi:hypothetical protein